MSDRLTIHRLRLWSHIGVPDEERAHPQMLEVTLRFKAPDVTTAAANDDLNYTINYFDIAQKAKNIAAERPRRLIETLAEDLATKLMDAFHLPRIEVSLRKYILTDAEAVELRIERKRKKIKTPKLRILEPSPQPDPPSLVNPNT